MSVRGTAAFLYPICRSHCMDHIRPTNGMRPNVSVGSNSDLVPRPSEVRSSLNSGSRLSFDHLRGGFSKISSPSRE